MVPIFVLLTWNRFRQNKKKVSASTNMAQIFMGGRSVFFFLLKIFYIQIRYANLNFSRAGNSNSDSLGTCRFCRHVAITNIRRTSLPESPRRCVCVGRLTTSQCVTSSSPLFRASSARAPLDRVPQWCEERHCAGVFSYYYFVRFLELKCEAWNSKTRYLQVQPATPRVRWHPRSRAEDVLCKKGFLSAGNLTDAAIGLAVDEKQLISWARTNQPKK